jgi:hypothetical protein
MVMQAYEKGLMIAVIPFTSKVLFLASAVNSFILFMLNFYFSVFGLFV